MEYILSLINSYVSDPQYAELLLYGVAAAGGITFAVALSLLFSGVYSPIKLQLQKMGKGEQTYSGNNAGFNQSLEHSLTKLPFIRHQFAGDNKTKRLLIHAGFQSQNALNIYNALKLIFVLISIGIAVIVNRLFTDLSIMLSIYLFAVIIGIAYLLPGLILTYLASSRIQNLRRFFPDALDLLVVCCESGLGLLEAFQRVGKELQFAHPELSKELTLVCSKVRAGYSMQDALHEFSERTGLEDIRGLNSVIVQSLKLGTGIADTLRVYADEYRDKRLQEAEEKAAKLGVKMVFPMMFCIWPSFFIVAIGPAVLKVMAVWGQAF
ncbi:MAG: tight adherence protein C [Psychromonas sp.]|jgi:tight adherence protein C|uniref:type II secretion system F family protein n=1 Tax=Psychromonas sp. TaxID=1884585 RepID=UPI0039E3B91F